MSQRVRSSRGEYQVRGGCRACVLLLTTAASQVKRGILLMLFGGVHKTTPEKTSLRCVQRCFSAFDGPRVIFLQMLFVLLGETSMCASLEILLAPKANFSSTCTSSFLDPCTPQASPPPPHCTYVVSISNSCHFNYGCTVMSTCLHACLLHREVFVCRRAHGQHCQGQVSTSRCDELLVLTRDQ